MENNHTATIRNLATAALVPSETTPGVKYVVRHADALDAVCECPDWTYRGAIRPCKHVVQVRAALAVLRANLPYAH